MASRGSAADEGVDEELLDETSELPVLLLADPLFGVHVKSPRMVLLEPVSFWNLLQMLLMFALDSRSIAPWTRVMAGRLNLLQESVFQRLCRVEVDLLVE